MNKQKKLNILVTGLCLQGNKGGPAIALSLMQLLNKHLNADYCFVVPSTYIAEEQQWGAKYGVSVVPTIGPKDMMPPYCWKTARRFRSALALKALEEADVLIDSSGISFIGPPAGRSVNAILNHQWSILAGYYHKPVFRWTQSYGPFSTRFVRLKARREFSKAPFLMARGYISRERLEKLGVKCSVYDFPDVAFCLPAASADWAATYLHKELAVPVGRQLLGLSPSAVLRNYPGNGGGTGEAHIEFCALLIEEMLKPGWDCLLIPHTIRVTGPASQCDLDVALKIRAKLSSPYQERVRVVYDDLDCRKLKSLIGKMDFFIGARYHSLIAALSKKVPSLAIAWHEKYAELFYYFALDEAVLDARGDISLSEMVDRARDLFENRAIVKAKIDDKLSSVIQAVEASGRLLAEAILDALSSPYGKKDES